MLNSALTNRCIQIDRSWLSQNTRARNLTDRRTHVR